MKQKMLWDVKSKKKRKKASSTTKREAKHFCSICGKPLYDPISIERGIGRECWEIIEQRKSKHKNLFNTSEE